MMKNKMKPSILPGFMELLPEEQLLFNDLLQRITKVYEQNGCMPMDTPVIEKEEILLAKSAGETGKQIYRIDKEKNKQALRFDLTVPFARYVVQHMNELTFPFKRYQVGKVYRGERNQKGRYREFYQLDVDIVNPEKLDIINDAFVISLADKAFKRIGLSSYVFQISNRKILSGLLTLIGIEKQQEVMSVIDKLDKTGKADCFKEIQELAGSSNFIQELLELADDQEQLISALKAFCEKMKQQFCRKDAPQRLEGYMKMKQGIEELEEVVDALGLYGLDKAHFKIELKIIRGQDYYTGTVFETILSGNEQYGSICSGGRYDQLTSLYTERKMEGVGISIGMTRLFFVLKETGFFKESWRNKKESYLVAAAGDTLKQCIKVNEVLLKQGKRSEVYLNGDSLKKQLRYASAKQMDYVVIVGEEELKRGKMLIKNMKTGQQEACLLP